MTRSRRRPAHPATKRPPSPEQLPFNLMPAAGMLATLLLALLLSWIFWFPLWEGGGLIGGDLYPYYFPQKVFLHNALQHGDIPFWNPFVGFGYPVLGESQTAALYPPNFIFYRLMSVNTAYNTLQIGHYLLAFCGTAALMGRLGLFWPGRLLAATAFVYGWFPARICLEWAIIGGAWFVWILWAATAFIQTRQIRYFVLLSLFLSLDLLAGHYNLAFITLLTLLPWPWLIRSGVTRPAIVDFAKRFQTALPPLACMWGAVLLGFLISGVQLTSTWELKRLSQRQTINDVFTPTYGHMPLLSMSQLWSPWAWSAGEKSMDEAISGLPLSVPNATNQAEAQLYVGLIPFLLAVVGLLWPRLRKQLPLMHPLGWLALAILSLLFATGWPTAYLSFVPGINFFRGPGRYSMTAALVFATVGGAVLDRILHRLALNSLTNLFLITVLLGVTTCDLWASSRQYQFMSGPFFGRQVFYATLLSDPPVNYLPESSLRKFFTEQGGRARLYAPGQNIPSMLNVSAIPVYLGLGPEIYESDDIRVDFTKSEGSAPAEATARLRRFGVTHLLLEHRLDTTLWPAMFLGNITDPFLNRALGRQEPFYFYSLNDSPGRVSLSDATDLEIRHVDIQPDRVRVEVQGNGTGTLVLRDLQYPGWVTTASSTTTAEYDPLFRCVAISNAGAGETIRTIEWTYRPASLWWGLAISVAGATCLVISSRFLPQLLESDPVGNSSSAGKL